MDFSQRGILHYQSGAAISSLPSFPKINSPADAKPQQSAALLSKLRKLLRQDRLHPVDSAFSGS